MFLYLDFDQLKIDGGFIHDIETNSLSQAIVRAIVDIARLLGIRTLAEFTTTRSTVERLCELGICGCRDRRSETGCRWRPSWRRRIEIPPSR